MQFITWNLEFLRNFDYINYNSWTFTETRIYNQYKYLLQSKMFGLLLWLLRVTSIHIHTELTWKNKNENSQFYCSNSMHVILNEICYIWKKIRIFLADRNITYFNCLWKFWHKRTKLKICVNKLCSWSTLL